MAFQSMMNGAECSTSSNPLNQFLKNTQGDSSLHQDRSFAQAGRQNNSIRQPHQQQQQANQGQDASQQQFFGPAQPQQMGPGPARPFDLHSMRAGLDTVYSSQQQQHLPVTASEAGAGAAWAQQMNTQGGPQLSRAPDVTSAAWADQFGRGGPQHLMGAGGSGAGAEESQSMMSMNRFGGAGGMMGMGMGGMGGMMGSYGMYGGGGLGMASRHMESAAAPAETQTIASETVRNEQWEAAFKELDEDQVKEQEPATVSKDKGKGKASEETANVLQGEEDEDEVVRRALDGMESAIRADSIEDRTRFKELWNAMKAEQGQNTDGNAAYDPDAELAEWERELMQNNIDEMLGLNHPGGGLGMGEAGMNELAGLDGTEDKLLNGIGSVDDNGYPRLGAYRFTANNPYAYHSDPLAEGLRLLSSGGSIADAALLFEVATQREVQGGTGGEQGEVDRTRRERSEAWRRLGDAQAMNERETQAIRALEEAIKIDGGNLEAYMSLAISYTNEGYDAAAHHTLDRYIQRAYPHIKPGPLPADLNGSSDPLQGTEGMNPWASLNRVTSLFLSAAREGNTRGAIDPEVQVGLGVLFYSSASYEQAKDCFQAALSVRPNDFLLWNRLGATLANGGKPEEAIQAYHRALELRPTFTRAIYNLSVSCLNLGAHQEAAEHLLSALALQKTHVLPDVPQGEQGPAIPLAEANESANLWSTLRRIFLSMDRMDLAQISHPGTPLSNFKSAGFEF
ncbi:unnamed protein product [Tilletia laevis]|uniref:Peroxisomal targeting signal receptor n=3 Tax=Tilletia TaxID=13289 RepID=A0A8X7SYE1_9BASI|nr:hypothetical protein CF336_g3043 [Tilletia laevis]KAE8251102.1 hypothetical protein A4X06_0g2807 [Tilletia controversa]KAE8263154.1 hypothetical protein A4X03_0g1888 [Tilletia caries]KAE8206771.1 hypothetical protein CF335_g1623 [Tilletia laevis]CAD6891974.1 unnamed protein product [Tilletia caries]